MCIWYHGLNGPYLWTVANSTLLARLTYASPAWWGLIGSEGLLWLQSVLFRAVKQGFLPPNQPVFDIICEKNDVRLFNAIINEHNHALTSLLPYPILLTNLWETKNFRVIHLLWDHQQMSSGPTIPIKECFHWNGTNIISLKNSNILILALD